MDAHAVLKAYFLANDIEGHVDTYSSVDKYAKKVKNQADSKTAKVNLSFFENKEIADTIAQMEEFLVLCKSAGTAAIDWPKCTRTKDLKWLQSMQESVGVKHRRRAEAMKEFISAEKKFGLTLKVHWAGWKISGGFYEKYIKLAVSSQKYALLLQKTFTDLVSIPVGIGSVGPAEFFALSQQCGTYASVAGDVAKSLKGLNKKNDQTIKECVQMIKESQAWVIWAKNDTAKNDAALKKSVKAGSPKK